MQAQDRSPAGLLPHAIVAGFAVGAVRAALVAVWQLDGDYGSTRIAAVATTLVVGSLSAIPVAWLAGAVARRVPTLVRVALALGLAGIAFAFATHRLPESGLFQIGATGKVELAVTFGAAVVSLFAGAIATLVRTLPLGRLVAGLVGTALIGAGLLPLTSSGARASWPERPNVVLVSLDTLRPDHLGAYGHERDTSPNLDRFAARSTVFDNAFTPQAWTLTAHMTMLTGLQPRVHALEKGRTLSPLVRTLAGELSLAGYATLGVVDDCMWLDTRFGFGRGFDVYHRVGGPAPTKIDQILEVLDTFTGSGPFFLFAHFYDAHSDVDQLPYEGDPEDLEAFASWYTGAFDGCDDEGRCASRFLTAANDSGWQPTDEQRRWILSLYDAGIRTLDRHLGRLFGELDARGVFDDSVVLVTSDHGEAFWEHGKALHADNYDPCLRVPFFVRTPDTSRGRSDALVSLEDVMPTLLELAGLEPPSGTGGRSLAALVRGESDPTFDERALASSSETRLNGVRTEELTLIRKGNGFELFRSSDVLQLEDVASDPALSADLAAMRARFEKMREDVEGLRSALAAESSGRELTEEERAALEDLGYLGD